MSRLQFTVEDITSKFEELLPLSVQDRNDEVNFLEHELRGKYEYINLASSSLAKQFHTMEMIEQETYFNNIFKSSYPTLKATVDIISKYRNMMVLELFQFHNQSLAKESEKLIANLNVMLKYTTITNDINLENIPEEDKDIIIHLNSYIEGLVEIYNEHFSPDYIVHDLNWKIKRHIGKHHNDPKSALKIEKSDDITLFSYANYYRNALLVLKKNAEDHAYNLENDIDHRLTSDFEKKLKIWIEPDEDEKLLTIYIQDNGFGVSPQMKNKLFEKGASEKTDKTSNHGIGLWYVKKFVEKNGGKIGFSTIQGYGTTFYFTVPYDRKKKEGIYLKD